MTEGLHHAPPGFTAITPYLTVTGADALLAFLKQAFAAEEIECHREDGKIRHGLVRIGDGMLELSEAQASWAPMPGAIHLYVPDADETYQRAMAAGATSLYEVTDMDYGERSGGVRDACGNNWYIATRTREGY